MKKTPVMYVISPSWVAEFYHAVAGGRYKGRKREQKAVEEIVLLAAESGLLGVPPA